MDTSVADCFVPADLPTAAGRENNENDSGEDAACGCHITCGTMGDRHEDEGDTIAPICVPRLSVLHPSSHGPHPASPQGHPPGQVLSGVHTGLLGLSQFVIQAAHGPGPKLQTVPFPGGFHQIHAEQSALAAGGASMAIKATVKTIHSLFIFFSDSFNRSTGSHLRTRRPKHR